MIVDDDIDVEQRHRPIISGEQLDVEAYAALYSSRTKIARLLLIADKCGVPSMELEALRMAYDEIKKGENTQLFREIVGKIDGRLGANYGLDNAWSDAVDRRAELRKEKLENELNAYRTNIQNDVATPRDGKDRIDVEQHCLARDIVNVIACEGKEMVERHELLGKWRSRFRMAGFEQCALSPYVNSVIGGLVKCYSEHYSLVEKDGAMLLGWKKRNLISASAWH